MSATKYAANVKAVIIEEIERLLKKKGVTKNIKVENSTNLFSGTTGLDSLDIAELIVVLEKKYGADPFKDGNFSIQTIEDFVSFYSARADNPSK